MELNNLEKPPEQSSETLPQCLTYGLVLYARRQTLWESVEKVSTSYLRKLSVVK